MRIAARVPLSGLVVLGLCFAPIKGLAQEDEVLEEIVVTGTRIPRDPNLTGALPVQTVNFEEIQLSGEFEISDIVNDIPALLTSDTSEQSGINTNVLELRGLGSVRTLVLVNGRRHVGGEPGSAAVDVGSIPTKLVERVEVLTGGASAIYGADAVTGVVNFILKDNYEGFGIDASYGISSEGDSQQTTLTANWGRNFANDRGNIAVSVDYRTDEGLLRRERPSELYGTAGQQDNPELRFQIGDIDTTSMPNFAQFYNFANTGSFRFGLPIPTTEEFITNFNSAFGSDPPLTPAEVALIDRAANAFPRAMRTQGTFPITSGYGIVIPGNPLTFQGFDPLTPIDLDNNGNPDCLDSFTGYNSAFGSGSFGLVGGCWIVSSNGSYAPIQNGLITDNFFGYGGDSFDSLFLDEDQIIIPDDKVTVNLNGHFDVTEQLTFFGEFKYVYQDIDRFFGGNSFWDLLFGAADNPFIPAFLQPLAQSTGGIAITVDPVHFDAGGGFKRDTRRAVIGLRGGSDDDLSFEISANYGRYEDFGIGTNQVIVDRWFAAIDAVIDPATGQPACRADVNPAAPPMSTAFGLPAYDPGYYSFTPGAGQCVPLNIWAGRPGVSQVAVDWVMTDSWGEAVIDQLVLSAFVTGDLADYFVLPAGPISFALGAEYRDESSELIFDSWVRGIIPGGAPFPAGSNVEDWSDNTSLLFQPQVGSRNEGGGFDVTDVFLETSVPLLANLPGAYELTLDAAVRYSDYSTVGKTTSWKSNLIYAPVKDLAFRGSVSEAVRAPNISELFAPESGTRFLFMDPCDAVVLSVLSADDPELAQQTQDNCIADFATIGLDPIDPTTGNYVYVNPLNASVVGVTSGNPALNEEKATTITAGFVFRPSFLDGLSITADFWDISIQGAIEGVSAQDIADGCYQGASLNQNFCQFLDRNSDPQSIFFGGFSFVRSTNINFAKIESAGFDFSVEYSFETGAHGFDIGVQGTRVDNIDFFTNPLVPSEVDVKLGEHQRPKLAGNIFLNWTWDDLFVGWQSQYLDKQLLSGTEIENAHTFFGPSVVMDELWRHDLNARYLLNDNLTIYGGINNVSNKKPFIREIAYPASARGRFFFLGIDYQM